MMTREEVRAAALKAAALNPNNRTDNEVVESAKRFERFIHYGT